MADNWFTSLYNKVSDIVSERPYEALSTLGHGMLWPWHATEAVVRDYLPNISYDFGMSGMLSDSNVYAPLKLMAGDILYDWGQTRGMLSQDIPQDVKEWYKQRAYDTSYQRNFTESFPLEQTDLFYMDDPSYRKNGRINWGSPAFVGQKTIAGSSEVEYPLPQYIKSSEDIQNTPITFKNEGWDYRPSYYQTDIPGFIEGYEKGKYGLMGILGKIGHTYGTKEALTEEDEKLYGITRIDKDYIIDPNTGEIVYNPRTNYSLRKDLSF